MGGSATPRLIRHLFYTALRAITCGMTTRLGVAIVVRTFQFCVLEQKQLNQLPRQAFSLAVFRVLARGLNSHFCDGSVCNHASYVLFFSQYVSLHLKCIFIFNFQTNYIDNDNCKYLVLKKKKKEKQ